MKEERGGGGMAGWLDGGWIERQVTKRKQTEELADTAASRRVNNNAHEDEAFI